MSKNRDPEWRYGISRYGAPVDIQDKRRAVEYYTSTMLSRTVNMFEYEGLPDTIPVRNLELQLQTNGFTGITDINGDLYAMYGGLGGPYDAYYMPTLLTVNNPALKYNKILTVDEDVVIMPNDSMYQGMLPMYSRYATLIAENDVTIRMAEINARLVDIISASDDRTYKSACELIKEIERGNLAVIADSALVDGIRAQPYAASGSTNPITQLIELQQYLKASWMNDIGLSANYNMKRESINSGEAQLGEDSMLTLVQDMLINRERAVDKINNMFGTSITVKLAGVWAKKEQAEDTEIAILESEEKSPVEKSVENVENKEDSVDETE